MRELREVAEPRPCAACGTVFQPRYKTRRVCSQECYYLLRRGHLKPRFPFVTRGGPACQLRRKPKARVFTAGYCADCGATFVVAAGKGDRYCSALCGVRSGRRLREARKRAARSERVYRARVFERDGWMCRLCGEPLDRAASAPHPLAPTLDHVVPLSLGGSHEYVNLQAAHFRCNSVKGANVTQLAFAA